MSHLQINDKGKSKCPCMMVFSFIYYKHIEAVGAILVLAFEEDNQTKIVQNTDLQIVQMLVKLRDTSKDKEVRQAADKTLWTLRNELVNQKEYKDIAQTYIQSKASESTESGTTEKKAAKQKTGHVMISYNRIHRKSTKKIKEILEKKKFSVWMDIKDMRFSTLGDMAIGVENASVVLVCYSRGYRNSPYCRLEAHYAFEKGKTIIPLKMDAGYEPDGWLGILISGIKFIDLSGKYPFNQKLEELCQRLDSSCSKEEVGDVDGDVNVNGGPVKAVTLLRKWTPARVEQWINKHNLPIAEFGRLTGRDLAGMTKMREEAPECFYNRLTMELKITSFATIDIFIEALDDIGD